MHVGDYLPRCTSPEIFLEVMHLRMLSSNLLNDTKGTLLDSASAGQ